MLTASPAWERGASCVLQTLEPVVPPSSVMRFFSRFAQGQLRLDRIQAFGDGVFAIVVTLLVLELRVPVLHDHANVTELGRQLLVTERRAG